MYMTGACLAGTAHNQPTGMYSLLSVTGLATESVQYMMQAYST